MKYLLLLCLFVSSSCSLIMQASNHKKIKTEHHVTMYKGFVDLLQENPGKSLDQLERQVFSSISLRQLEQTLGDRAPQRFEDKKMYPNVAQLCAILRIKLFLREIGAVSQACISNDQKKPGVVDQYFQEKLQLD